MGKQHTPRELPTKESLREKAELDAFEAGVYADMHPDYIKQLCRQQAIESRKVFTPGGFYYLVKRASLDSYLSVPHKPGPKRHSPHTGKTQEGGDTQTEAAA